MHFFLRSWSLFHCLCKWICAVMTRNCKKIRLINTLTFCQIPFSQWMCLYNHSFLWLKYKIHLLLHCVIVYLMNIIRHENSVGDLEQNEATWELRDIFIWCECQTKKLLHFAVLLFSLIDFSFAWLLEHLKDQTHVLCRHHCGTTFIQIK